MIYTVVVVTMVLPVVGNTASELQLVKALGIFDTIPGNWIQKFNFLGMYYLVFYATFRGIPNDFAEAAYVDGAGETHVMVRIIFPLVANIFVTVMLIKFIGFWNDYQTPLLFLPTHPTIAYGVYYLTVSFAAFFPVCSEETSPSTVVGSGIQPKLRFSALVP